jgi:hypothetical protein
VSTAVVVILIAVGVPLYLWFMWHLNQRRNERARAVAASAGLNIDLDSKDPPPAPFDLFERGRSRRVSFHMWATGGQDSVFRYRYTTGSGKSRQTHRCTCALIDVPFNAPYLTIGPEGFWSNLGQIVGIRDIEVESPEFNDRYRVKCDDERFAITLVDHRMIAWMLGDGGAGAVRFELLGRQLLCISDELDIEQMPGMLGWTARIRQHLPAVLTELYPIRA